MFIYYLPTIAINFAQFLQISIERYRKLPGNLEQDPFSKHGNYWKDRCKLNVTKADISIDQWQVKCGHPDHVSCWRDILHPLAALVLATVPQSFGLNLHENASFCHRSCLGVSSNQGPPNLCCNRIVKRAIQVVFCCSKHPKMSCWFILSSCLGDARNGNARMWRVSMFLFGMPYHILPSGLFCGTPDSTEI